MAKTIVINNSSDFTKLVDVCETFTDEKDYPLDVTVKKHDTSIVAAQRGLYWVWVTTICKTTGDTKLELHEQFKESIFLNIYIADIENHPTFEGIVDAMKLIRDQAPDQYPTLRAAVMHGVSHLDATKANWHDVFQSVEMIAQRLKVKLPASDRQGVQR